MDWNRAKNIIIGLLCALNVFLLGNYLYGRYAQSDASQTQAELEIYLENRGVSLACQLPHMQTPARGLNVAEGTEKLAARALAVLLGTDVRQDGFPGSRVCWTVSFLRFRMEAKRIWTA